MTINLFILTRLMKAGPRRHIASFIFLIAAASLVPMFFSLTVRAQGGPPMDPRDMRCVLGMPDTLAVNPDRPVCMARAGLDQRFMVFSNSTASSDSIDRLGFFNMENALYITFQPHDQLTLVYSRDGFNQTATTQDAFGCAASRGRDCCKW